MSRHFLTLLILISAVGCGPQRKKAKPPAPCTTGINQEACSVELKDRSLWKREFKVFSEHPETKVKKLEQVVTIFHQFANIEGNSLWRRTITIAIPNQKFITMYHEGRLTNLTSTTVTFQLDKSSCDNFGTWASQTLYYKRSGNDLEFRSDPFPEPIKGGIGNVLGTIVAESIGTVVKGTIEATFDVMLTLGTFGLIDFVKMRDQLNAGIGQFKAFPKDEAFAFGEVGCFSTISSKGEFTHSKDQTLSW